MYVLEADYQADNCSQIFTKSVRETGFGILRNHPINVDLIRSVYTEWQNFYNGEDKFQYLFNKQTYDGYYPFRSENAKGYPVKNLMEYYHLFPWGQFPNEVSDKARQLYDHLLVLGQEILTWLNTALPEAIKHTMSQHLPDMITESPLSVMRIIHYPPLTGEEEAGALRAYDHEDINLITLLPVATANGLQVKDSDGNWHAVECHPGTIIINAGDMLQMATQGYFKSTTHRVINPVGEDAKKSRMSMPLFIHPRAEVKLSDNYTADDYLMERMRENGIAA